MSTIRRPICPVKETSLKPIGDEEFLRLVWPDKLLTHETLELRAFNRTESAIERKFATSIDQFLAFAHSYGEGWDVYFGVATRFREGGKKQNCYRVRTMWADLDHRRIEECLDFDPKPDILVNSGGGVHAYWLYYVKMSLPQHLTSATICCAESTPGPGNLRQMDDGVVVPAEQIGQLLVELSQLGFSFVR